MTTIATPMREASDDERADYLAGQVTFPGAQETEHGLLVPDLLVTTGGSFIFRESQENGDYADCQTCGKTLDDDHDDIVNNHDGFAFCSARCILADHDAGEDLHVFEPSTEEDAEPWQCADCGDTAEGLMHSNTDRDIEPLLWTDEDAEENGYGSDEPDAQTLADADDALTRLAERTTTAYDPRFDTARVDEATVRALVGIGVSLRGVGVILVQGRFTPGGSGCYGSVVVLCDQGNGRGFSTNRAIVRAEDGQPVTVYAEAGHYDMSREDAEADLLTR